MYISTATKYFERFDDKTTVAFLKECGFDAYDFTMYAGAVPFGTTDHVEKAKAFRAYSESIGIVCHQTHAPFPTAKQGEDEYNKDMFAQIVRSIEISGALGARVCVVHPSVEHTIEENILLFQALEPHARKAGVKIGVENMTRDIGSHHTHIQAILAGLPEDIFVFCLDTGHAEIAKNQTSAVDMIRTMGKRLQAIHLHDCDQIRDNHGLPFTYKINFEQVIEELKKVGYTGDIMLETGSFFREVPAELLPIYTKTAVQCGKYFKARLENKNS